MRKRHGSSLPPGRANVAIRAGQLDMAVVHDIPISASGSVSINDQFTRAQTRAGLILALPASVLIAALLIGPAILVFILSFTDASLGLAGARFVGLGNYVRMLTDPGLSQSLRNTAL